MFCILISYIQIDRTKNDNHQVSQMFKIHVGINKKMVFLKIIIMLIKNKRKPKN